jgi:hypothetical protein
LKKFNNANGLALEENKVKYPEKSQTKALNAQIAS